MRSPPKSLAKQLLRPQHFANHLYHFQGNPRSKDRLSKSIRSFGGNYQSDLYKSRGLRHLMTITTRTHTQDRNRMPRPENNNVHMCSQGSKQARRTTGQRTFSLLSSRCSRSGELLKTTTNNKGGRNKTRHLRERRGSLTPDKGLSLLWKHAGRRGKEQQEKQKNKMPIDTRDFQMPCC